MKIPFWHIYILVLLLRLTISLKSLMTARPLASASLRLFRPLGVITKSCRAISSSSQSAGFSIFLCRPRVSFFFTLLINVDSNLEHSSAKFFKSLNDFTPLETENALACPECTSCHILTSNISLACKHLVDLYMLRNILIQTTLDLLC